MKMTAGMERFIHHWGEMGPKWGVNRSVAETHALLYLSAEPIPAEEIAETLGIARSNVSMSLKELQSWGIIKVHRKRGDRRDHYSSLEDVWELFRVVLDERKAREIDPTLAVLEECVDSASKGKSAQEKVVEQRIRAMISLFRVADGWYGHMRTLPLPALKTFLKMGAKVRGWVSRR